MRAAVVVLDSAFELLHSVSVGESENTPLSGDVAVIISGHGVGFGVVVGRSCGNAPPWSTLFCLLLHTFLQCAVEI